MKNPGPFKAGTPDNLVLLDFCKMMANRFDVAMPAMLGKLVHLNEVMCDATETDAGFGSILIALDSNGCLTGDCPHEKQSECDEALGKKPKL